MPRFTKDGEDLSVPAEDRRYVALAHMRFGDGFLEPGDIVPVEAGRNYASLLRQRKIAVVIDGEAI
jgi:hypothetical protein